MRHFLCNCLEFIKSLGDVHLKENQRVAVTKKMLREGLIRLLRAKELDKIHINELCREAGINRATFYRHYKTPRDVLQELESELIRQLIPLTKTPGDIREAQKMLEATCTYIYDHADVAKILFRCNSDESLMLGLNEFYRQFLKIWKKERPSTPMDEAATRIVIAGVGGGAYCLLRQWILEDIPKTPSEISSILCSVLRWPLPAELLEQDNK